MDIKRNSSLETKNTNDEILSEWYGSAVSLYSNALNTINQRNATFLVVQAIFITAFSVLLTEQSKIPYAMPIFSLGIVIAGSIFCFIHHLSGLSEAQNAYNWRGVWCSLDRDLSESPWKKFDNYSGKKHQKHGVLTFSWKKISSWLVQRNRLQCAKCIGQRLPQATAWIITPWVFAVGWCIASLYLTVRTFIKEDEFGQNPYIPIQLLEIVAIISLLWTIIVVVYIILNFASWKNEEIESYINTNSKSES